MKVMDQKTAFVACVSLAAALSGCIAAPTWVDRGPGEVTTSGGRIACYNDAHLIDGKRVEGELCATSKSGFLGGGEPKIDFGPWGRPLMSNVASETTVGITRSRDDVTYFLQCIPLVDAGRKTETGRECKVTANGQLLVSVVFTYGAK